MRCHILWIAWIVAGLQVSCSGHKPLGGTLVQPPQAQGPQGASQNVGHKATMDRREFAARLQQIRDDDTRQSIEKRLGKPDDILRAPDPVPYPTDEIWCYGTEGHGSLPTLGQVCLRKGRVVWTSDQNGVPPSPSVISEQELRAGMRFLHPGPEAAGYNDPLHLIRTANYLQPLGKEKALAIIGEYARISASGIMDQTWLFLLLRTLFEVPRSPGYMPEMYIGAMDPPPPADRKRIPRFPIVLIDDVPFSLLSGVSLAGTPEPVSHHIAYFRKQGTLRAGLLHPPADPFVSFKRLMASKEWTSLNEDPQIASRRSGYEGHILLQMLTLVRTAYGPPVARQPFAYLKPSDYERYHAVFLEVGAYWEERSQMYVRKDGSHEPVGRLERYPQD